MQPDEQEKKSMKKNKHNIWDFGDTIKHTNVCIMRVKEGEKKKGAERIVEEIITWKHPKLDEKQSTHTRSSLDCKQDKFREMHT